MKKILSAVLILMMVLSLSQGALGEAGFKTYVHKSGYSVQYPSDWLALDAENITTFMNDANVRKMYPNTDFNSVKQQIISTDMVMFAAANGDNVNIMSVYIGAPYNAEQLIAELCPSLIDEYNAVMPGAEIFSNGDIREAGGKEYAFLTYHWDSAYNDIIGMQFMNCDTGVLYYLTFTSGKVDDTVSFMKNFRLVEKMLETLTF